MIGIAKNTPDLPWGSSISLHTLKARGLEAGFSGLPEHVAAAAAVIVVVAAAAAIVVVVVAAE